MSSNKIRRLPVTKQNRLVGIVVAADFVRNLGKRTSLRRNTGSHRPLPSHFPIMHLKKTTLRPALSSISSMWRRPSSPCCNASTISCSMTLKGWKIRPPRTSPSGFSRASGRRCRNSPPSRCSRRRCAGRNIRAEQIGLNENAAREDGAFLAREKEKTGQPQTQTQRPKKGFQRQHGPTP